MPGKVKVKILAGRNLPVMDRSSDTTDAYVEVKLGNTTFKTDVCRKSLNPQWNTEWYRFEVDDSELQDEPLQIRLMDHDTYSANDAIGKVYLDLNPLLLPDAVGANNSRGNETGPNSSSSLVGGNVMSGWIPVYDTMHGIRGEVNVIVKVELFSDFNKFRQSSCGVQFFCSGSIPHGYHAQVIHGFVEELVVNDDPEYQWIDKIRTPRASNEARQTLFFKLSGEVQRKIGLKALDLGGNAVIGYYQCFDLEGESGIVVRGIGTAVTLVKLHELSNPPIEVVPTEDLPVCDNNVCVDPNLSPRLRVIPPSPSEESVPRTVMGIRFPGVGSLKVKKRPVVTVIPAYMSAHPDKHRSTQSLNAISSVEDRVRGDEKPRRNPFSRGLKAMGFGKRITALRARLSNAEEDSESDTSGSEAVRVRSASVATGKKPRFKFVRRHKRSSSDSMATALVLSLMGNTNLDRVVEVKESPNSSPSSPPRCNEAVPDFLRVPEDIPDLTYVDGHLISNNSSGVSSSSDSSSSEGSEEFLLDPCKQLSSASPSPEVRHQKQASCFTFKSEDNKQDCINESKLVHNTTIQQDENNAIIIQVPSIDVPSVQNTPSHVQPTETGMPHANSSVHNHHNNQPIEMIVHETTLVNNVPDPSPPDDAVDIVESPLLASPSPARVLDNHVCGGSSSLLAVPVTMSPLHKSKSASELSPHGTNIDRHGTCLLPSDRPITELDPEDEANEEATHLPPKMAALPAIHRRSSDSDLSITPKGNSLTGTGSDRSSMGTHLRAGPTLIRPTMNQESLDMLEYPFLTMTTYPPGFILHLGGCVSSRSVKLLERVTNLDEPESRDIWWSELRMEVRSHARALGCNVVLGYSENTSICDDVCVLSASGTAAIISLAFTGLAPDSAHVQPRNHLTLQHKELMTTSLDRTEFEAKNKPPDIQIPVTPGSKVRPPSCDIPEVEPLPCAVCHIPYTENSVPFRVTMIKCAVCKRGRVPDVLFATIEPMESLPLVGKGCFIQAYTVKAKRDSHGELNATEISDGLPFLEYELHRLLVNKLKVKGMNAIFKLKVQVSIGEKLLVGLATGTAVFLSALPAPAVPQVCAGKSWSDDRKLADLQRNILDTVKRSRDALQLGKEVESEGEESEDDLTELDLAAGNKDSCVLEVDDWENMEVVTLLIDPPDPPGFHVVSTETVPEAELTCMFVLPGNKDSCVLEVDDWEDVEVVTLLIDPPDPPGFHVVSTETVPGLDHGEVVRNLQMFTQVWRAKIPLSQNQQGQCQNPLPSAYSPHFQGMLQSVFFKLRRMSPCALCDLQFKVMMSEADEIQLSVYGMALGLGEPARPGSRHRKRPPTGKKSDDVDLMFSLEEDPTVDPASVFKARPYSPFRARTYSNSLPHHTAPSERYGVDLTPLSYVPGGKIERYLGNLNFFFIRESTSVRECGGLSGFIHSFLTEVLAIVRAHVTALGGNAMVAYFVSECVLYHNPHKNQGQCLINVGGDVVYVSYTPG